MSVMIGGKPKNTSTPKGNKEVSSKEETSNAIEKEDVKKKTTKRK